MLKNDKFAKQMRNEQQSVENNAAFYFNTIKQRKNPTLFLRPYAQSVLKVYDDKVRKSMQFENFAFLCHQT